MPDEKYDVIGAVVDRPTAEKFRKLCKPDTTEEVIETFIKNVINGNIKLEQNKV